MTDDLHSADAKDRPDDQQPESIVQITQWGECDVFISYSKQRDSLLLDIPYTLAFGDRLTRDIARQGYGESPTDESVEIQRQQLHAHRDSLPESCGAIAYRTIALSDLSQFRTDHERAYQHWRDSSPELKASLDALQDFIDVLATVERAVADVQSSGNHSCNPPQEVVESVEQAFALQSTGLFDRLRNVAKRQEGRDQ